MSIDNIDNNVKDMILASNDLGLLSGKTGACVYSYCNPDAKGDGAFNEKLGEALIDEIFEKVGWMNNLGVPHGLSGVGLGLIYLMQNSYVAGNPDKVLKMLDEIIYRRIAFMDKSSMIEVDDMLGILFYLCARLKYGLKKHTERDIFSELVAKMTDYIYSCKDAGFFSETCPYTVYSKGIVFLFATCRIYELGIHCGRLSKIWTEVKLRLFQYIPYMQASRLQVMLVAKKVAILNNDMEWHSYSSFLRENFSWNKLVCDEYRDRQIFFTDGLAGSYLMAKCYNCISDADAIDVDEEDVYKRITRSSVWQDYENGDVTCRNGLDGYLGIKLLLSNMKKGGW